MIREQRRQLDELRETVDELQREVNRPPSAAQAEQKLQEIPSADQVVQKAEYPPSAAEQQWPLPIGREGKGGRTSLPPKEPVMIGDISVLSNPATTADLGNSPDKKRLIPARLQNIHWVEELVRNFPAHFQTLPNIRLWSRQE